jgi:NitT/TauT family transport system substrate-binding protein
MTAYRLTRRASLGLAAVPLLLPLARPARAQRLDRLVFQTDWRAQAEHGGYYQAVAAGPLSQGRNRV